MGRTMALQPRTEEEEEGEEEEADDTDEDKAVFSDAPAEAEAKQCASACAPLFQNAAPPGGTILQRPSETPDRGPLSRSMTSRT